MARLTGAWGTFLIAFGLMALYVAFIRHGLLEGPLQPAGVAVGVVALAGAILVHDGLHIIRRALRCA